jgi:predicted GIY-YIG superfamily endonuclease
MKTCPKCSLRQSLDQFGVDRSRGDGLQVWCRTCQRNYRQENKDKIRSANQEWKKANPDKVRASHQRQRSKPEVKLQRAEYNQEWKKANPDKVRAQGKRSYVRHAEERRALSRKYAAENPDRVKAATQRWRSENQDHIKSYRKANRHQDRAYYKKNAESIRQKKEDRRQWVVYRISFGDGSFYVGSSSHADLRFNAHKSLAERGVHVESLRLKDFSTAHWEVLKEYPSEESALEGEAQFIQEAWAAEGKCLNKTLPALPKVLYWVYVIQSLCQRVGPKGNSLPGFFYVGMTSDPSRRLREHNGLYANGKPGNPNGGKYTSKHRPWVAKALHGPFFSRSEALRAEYALKRGKRGEGRLCWKPEDSEFCRGAGVDHEWVQHPHTWSPPTPEEWRNTLPGA